MTIQWRTAWAQAMTDLRGFETSFSNVTLRLRVETGVSGERIRLELSNRFGDDALIVNACAVAVNDGPAVPALFAGCSGVTIDEGGTCRSDPAFLRVRRSDELRIDLYLPESTLHATGNHSLKPVEVSTTGNHLGANDFPAIATPTIAAPDYGEMPIPTPYLRSVEVAGGPVAAIVVCLGDSIASGWPARVAALLSDRIHVAMLNQGIAGNRLCTDANPAIASYGLSGVSRFDDDVLAIAGVTEVVIALGTNDLGLPGNGAPVSDLPSAAQLIDAYARLAEKSAAAGLGVTIATITPFLPADGYDSSRDQIRVAVNDWIRSCAPGVVDFDAAVRATTSPDRLADKFDSGDHLHPNQSGKEQLALAMAHVLAEKYCSAVH